jgi:hypothetical protein
MDKDELIQVRVTRAEKRAVLRFAKAEHRTLSDLVRGRVIIPALTYDPRQMDLLTQKEERPRRAG